MEGGVLSIDAATETGWAYGKPGSIPCPTWLETNTGVTGDIKHMSGTLRLASERSDPVDKWLGMEQFLNDQIIMLKPRFIAYEAPFVGGRKNGKNTSSQDMARMLLGLACVIEMVSKKHSIQCYEINISTWRSHFMSKGTGPRAEMKRLCQMRCDKLGWKYKDDNEADSLGLLDYAIWWLTDRGMMPQPEGEITPADNLPELGF